MTPGARDEERDELNGAGPDPFVRRSELHGHATTVLEALGRVARELGDNAKELRGVREELADVRDDMVKLQKGEKLVRRKLRSLPEQIAEKVEEAEENTKTTNLKKELASVKRTKRIWIGVLLGVITIVGGGGILHALGWAP